MKQLKLPERTIGSKGLMATLFASTALGYGLIGAASASAYSCQPNNGFNLCTFFDGYSGAGALQYGVWHHMQWVDATNIDGNNRLVYADGMLSNGQSYNHCYGNYYCGAGQDGNWVVPRVELVFTSDLLLGREQY
jgi:hypothetical protein